MNIPFSIANMAYLHEDSFEAHEARILMITLLESHPIILHKGT
jgi:hypothetical protein